MDELTKVVAEEVVEAAAEKTAEKAAEGIGAKVLIGGVCTAVGTAIGWFSHKLFAKHAAEKAADQDFLNNADDEFEEVKED